MGIGPCSQHDLFASNGLALVNVHKFSAMPHQLPRASAVHLARPWSRPAPGARLLRRKHRGLSPHTRIELPRQEADPEADIRMPPWPVLVNAAPHARNWLAAAARAGLSRARGNDGHARPCAGPPGKAPPESRYVTTGTIGGAPGHGNVNAPARRPAPLRASLALPWCEFALCFFHVNALLREFLWQMQLERGVCVSYAKIVPGLDRLCWKSFSFDSPDQRFRAREIGVAGRRSAWPWRRAHFQSHLV